MELRYPAPERLLDSHAVALILGVTERTIRAWAAAGEFGRGTLKVGKKLWRFRASAIEAYVTERENRQQLGGGDI
ncbi:MAG: helix-turn-helix domain-containing protein [Acidobacteriia bacterium]|nr:helix-turn-helix domain-containing protein [Terriglobia bacterium]